MEAVKKIVSLEPFYSRMKSSIPFVGMVEGEVYPSLNWGKVAYGVDFQKLYNSDRTGTVNLYGNGIKYLGKMTFSEIMQAYHSVKKNKVVIPDDLTTEEKRELEKLRSIIAFVDSKRVIDPQTVPADPCCDPCARPSPPPQYEMDNYENYYFAPTVCMNICLVQSANLVGAYTFAEKDWVAGKRYFEGDKVIYDGMTMKLKPFTNGTISINGARFYKASNYTDFKDYDDAYIGISKELFDECTVKSESEIVKMGYIYAKCGGYYYLRPSWGGYFNEKDGKTYFDVLNNPEKPDLGLYQFGQYETTHWVVDDDIISHGEYLVEKQSPGVKITGKQTRVLGYGYVDLPTTTSESKLVNFKRNTKTITDDLVELPGKLNSNTTSVLDLQYIVGTVKNIDTTGDVVIGDVLMQIRVISDNGTSFTIGAGDNLDGHSGNVVDGDTGIIKFTYYIGANLVLGSDDNYVYDGSDPGLIYVDTYRYDVKTDSAVINGRNRTYRYFDIDYDSAKGDVVYENLDNYEDRVILSEVTGRKQSITEGGSPVSPDFQNAHYFMEDYQLGLAFVANNNENVYIDRGTAAAFERHMRLSEVDTLQDLENYGNGMFKLKE